MTDTPLPGLPTRTAHRLGRRGTVLVCIGIIWIMFGSSILGARIERFSRPGPSPLDFLDSTAWGWMWIGGGVVAFVTAWVPTMRRIGVGYNALALPAFLWTLFYGWSFLVYTATAGEYGEPRTWIGATVWLSAVIMLVVINGWEEHPGQDDPLGIRRRRGGS